MKYRILYNSGDVVGNFVYLEDAPPLIHSGRQTRAAKLKCFCGKEFTTRLTSAKTVIKSCGCMRVSSNTTHGYTKKAEYRAWRTMKRRCLSENVKEFNNYGGRGITVCERWLHSFENFIADMGNKPSMKHSLDRINNDGNYEPSNCRWATRKQQDRNTRRTVLLTLNNETLCKKDWAEKLNISESALILRLEKWPLEKALSYPAQTKSWSRNRKQGESIQ